ncbi:putative RNA ligase [Salicola phage SCTP-2]|nr:putative RNA ligase [Salicola phage SCTP-2]
MSRKLVSVRTIDDLNDIENADNIVVATVDGWNIVTKKGEFDIGDYCVMFEIDSFLPIDDERFEFLKKSSYKKMNGKEGLRLKTIKLRGVVSQGLALPINYFPEVMEYARHNGGIESVCSERHDLSELLSVEKYEIPDMGTGARPAGDYPFFVPKTDEERLENLYNEYSEDYKDTWFTPTMKLDGSSTTLVYVNNDNLFYDTVDVDSENNDQWFVCSRNLALCPDTESFFWKGWQYNSVMDNLVDWCRKNDHQLAVQGELMGPGIQGNKEQFNTYRVYVFRMFDITNQTFLTLDETKQICDQIGAETVPVFEPIQLFTEYDNLEAIMKRADGKSINYKNREGLVYINDDDPNNRVSFKTISHKFLLKSED